MTLVVQCLVLLEQIQAKFDSCNASLKCLQKVQGTNFGIILFFRIDYFSGRKNKKSTRKDLQLPQQNAVVWLNFILEKNIMRILQPSSILSEKHCNCCLGEDLRRTLISMVTSYVQC